MAGWDELFCFRCNKHVGWMTYSGPHGLVFCDECKEVEDEEELEEATHD